MPTKKTTEDTLKLLEPANPMRRIRQGIENHSFITKPTATAQKHEQTHTKYGTDAIDSILDEGALGLTTRGDIVFLGATDLARLAVGNADEFLGSDGTDPSWRTAAQVMASLSGEAAAPFSMNSQRITDLADAIDPTDAVNLRDVLDHVGITLNYWLSNQTLVELLVNSEAALTETPSSTPETLSTITFKSSIADTPTPFDINPGSIVELHFAALVAAGGGRSLGLHAVFGYMDSDSANFVQIGSDSDSTDALSTDKTSYTLHMHVDSAIEVPAGKRLWLKFVSTSLSGGGSYPQISVYYDDPAHHLIFGVAGSVLGNFLLLSGSRAMTGELDMGTDKIINVVDPTANQDAATKKYVDDEVAGAGGAMATDALWDAVGDLAVGTGANTGAKLAVGADNLYLKVATNTPGWEALDISEDATPTAGGPIDMNGNDINNGGVVFLTEQAAAEADVTGKGQLWVKTATPNSLWFVDDTGQEYRMGGSFIAREPTYALIDTSRTTQVEWTDIDLSSYIPATARWAVLFLSNDTVSFTSGTIWFGVRDNGTSSEAGPIVYMGRVTGDRTGLYVIVGCDTSQIIEYKIRISGTATINSFMGVIGHIE